MKAAYFQLKAVYTVSTNNITSSLYTPIALANVAANVKGAHNFFAGDPMYAFIILGGLG